jgi:hypothetical protein
VAKNLNILSAEYVVFAFAKSGRSYWRDKRRIFPKGKMNSGLNWKPEPERMIFAHGAPEWGRSEINTIETR